mmetsp:Transcript_30967/g.100935  ORF Transcript_30967/g.100935 Transcript_30967/m.100935 type:complete len:425 (-) Transcript_30967:23-1297(-)
MYTGAEDISALVVEVGHHASRFGHAGEDAPLQCPSNAGVLYAAEGEASGAGSGAGAASAAEAKGEEAKPPREYYVGDSALGYRRDRMELRSCFADGQVCDWDHWERLIAHGVGSLMGARSEEHPIMLIEPSYNDRDSRYKMAEMLFETFHTPAAFLAKDAALACYANGRWSGVVLDFGAGFTKVVPVQDGFVMANALQRSPVAGNELDRFLVKVIQERHHTAIRPLYECKRVEGGAAQIREFPRTHPTYRTWAQEQVARQLKESLCRTSEVAFEEGSAPQVPKVAFELPDGTTVTTGAERFMVPELLINPSPLGSGANPSLGKMFATAVYQCEPEFRKDLYNGVVVTGGSSAFPGFAERVGRELPQHLPEVGVRLKVLAATPTERKVGPWLGGSILASLGSFHEMWVSRSEYQEHGNAVVDKLP